MDLDERLNKILNKKGKFQLNMILYSFNWYISFEKMALIFSEKLEFLHYPTPISRLIPTPRVIWV